jgi:hypothetical protein
MITIKNRHQRLARENAEESRVVELVDLGTRILQNFVLFCQKWKNFDRDLVECPEPTPCAEVPQNSSTFRYPLPHPFSCFADAASGMCHKS